MEATKAEGGFEPMMRFKNRKTNQTHLHEPSLVGNHIIPKTEKHATSKYTIDNLKSPQSAIQRGPFLKKNSKGDVTALLTKGEYNR